MKERQIYNCAILRGTSGMTNNYELLNSKNIHISFVFLEVLIAKWSTEPDRWLVHAVPSWAER